MIDLPRKFRGVWIPKEIWISEELTITEKCLFAEIDSLGTKNECYAKNSHFSKFIGVSEVQISRLISKLKSKGFITVKQENIGGKTKRIITTAITFCISRSPQHLGPDALTFRDTNVALNDKASTSNTMSNTIDLAPASGASFVWTQYLDKMFESKNEAIQIIAFYFQSKGISFETVEQAREAIKRHIAAANRVAKFPEQKVRYAMKIAQNEYPKIFTIETLLKILTR